MKKLLLLSIFCFVSITSFAQDPAFVGTWYVRGFNADLEPTVFITSQSAPQNPTLTIHPDFTFEGLGACNTFTGTFVYNTAENVYYHDNFVVTTDDCGTVGYNGFEDYYFGHFNDSDGEFVSLRREGSTLFAEVAPGFGVEFQDSPFLGIQENQLFTATLFPNPAATELFIRSKQASIQSYVIYAMTGNKVVVSDIFDTTIDVSFLASGIYFLEAVSEEGKAMLQFVKD